MNAKYADSKKNNLRFSAFVSVQKSFWSATARRRFIKMQELLHSRIAKGKPYGMGAQNDADGACPQ